MNPITIITKRLALLPIAVEHADAIFENFTSEITTYMYPKPAAHIEEVHDFIQSSLETMATGTNLQMVITDIADSSFLGCIGLHRLDSPIPELGIWLKKSAHGRGYGHEAIAALVDWARNNTDYRQLKYPVDERNQASRKIPVKLGGVVNERYVTNGLGSNSLKILEYLITIKS